MDTETELVRLLIMETKNMGSGDWIFGTGFSWHKIYSLSEIQISETATFTEKPDF